MPGHANLLCRLTGHPEPAESIWNDGYYFASCPRCSATLCKRQATGKWKVVPPRYTVVWKQMTDTDREFRRTVGLLHDGVRLPARPMSERPQESALEIAYRREAALKELSLAWKDDAMLHLTAIAGRLGIPELKRRVQIIERLLND